MRVFTLKWKLFSRGVKDDPNITTIYVKAVDENGVLVHMKKKYREWIGVCTDNIKKQVNEIQYYFPGCVIQTKRLDGNLYKKVLPYFRERLAKNKLGYSKKSFYKVYTSAPVSEVGEFFRKHKFSYYDTEDWLTRIYIDMCALNKNTEFCHKWYDVKETEEYLINSFVLLDDAPAPITIAAFDLETVPIDGCNRIPTGHDENDRIVMISVCKWRGDHVQEALFYLNPFPRSLNTPFREFYSEREMLESFFEFVQDAVVITGYNINGFDTPCLFARLKFLNMSLHLGYFTSRKMGNHLVPTWSDKISIDMYSFVQTFSSYDLPSLKLDAVAKKKLNSSKVAIHPVTIHDYYCQADRLTVEMVIRDDKSECFEALRPKRVKEREFGTFFTCLEYCLQDSVLVRRLFEHEQAFRFLVERANFSAFNLEDCLYFGNSRYILEVMKTYGTMLGWFVNGKFFCNTLAEDKGRLKEYFTEKGTYQGALNHCKAGHFYRNVNVYDFVSMYPSILVNQNLCFGTCDILKVGDCPVPDTCSLVPYRVHKDHEFLNDQYLERYQHPAVSNSDRHVMVWYHGERGFLPDLVKHFIAKRIEEKNLLRVADSEQKIMHHNKQLNIKIFLNSIYGCMASTDTPIAYLPIAMSITAFARIYLLASNQYFLSRGCTVAYCDTDSIFVVSNNESDKTLNAYLGQMHMSLAFEQNMKSLLVVSKKRYVYENSEGKLLTKGFEKKSNDMVQYMTQEIVNSCMHALQRGDGDPSDGWITWINTLVNAKLMCRDSTRYFTTRKTKELDDYKSQTCPQLKLLKRYPHLSGQTIDFTYSQADVQARFASQWIMLPEDCRQVDFEKMFVSQKKILVTLLNSAYWKMNRPEMASDRVLLVMKWKSFMNAEFKSWLKTEKNIMILTERGQRYTFKMM